jgi:hypothetical protein
MEDIILTMPWRDYDKGSVVWNQTNYCLHEDGEYAVDHGCEGDDEPIDESEIPSHEEYVAAWDDYRKHVAATGEDPLYAYIVKRTYKRKARYTLQFRNSIGGAFLCRWKRGRGEWSASTPPEDVIGYMLLDDWPPNHNTANRRPIKDSVPQPDGTLKRTHYPLKEFLDLARADESVLKVTRRGPFHNIHLTLEEEIPRKPSAITRELRRRARPQSKVLKKEIKQAQGGEQ